MNKKLLQARDNIIEAAGRATQGFGMGRIIGQLYALLYFSSQALCLDDMARELRVSKGSVSTNIRELEKWGAVRQVWIRGDRRDYYEAEVDFLRILRDGIIPVFKRKVDSASVAIAESRSMIGDGRFEPRQEGSELARFYLQRLELLDKTRSRLALFAKEPVLQLVDAARQDGER